MVNQSTYPILRQLRKMAARQAVKERTDLELLQQFASTRDESAFAALVERHGPLVWGVCLRVLRDGHDAEDAFQATFLVLARRASSVCKKESAGSWLYGVAYRTALSQKRAAQRRCRREQREQHREPEQPASAASLRELQAMLDEELARLPAKYGAPFVLCCLEGKSYAQAARELDCKEGTVSSRLAKARELLQARLTRRGVTLCSVLCATALSSSEQTAPAALIASTTEGVLLSLSGTSTAALSAQAVTLANAVTKPLSVTALKIAAILLLAAAPPAFVGLSGKSESSAQQQAEAVSPAPPQEAKRPKPGDNKADLAGAEMHVIGVYSANNRGENQRGSIQVEVRPTAKPVVLVLTSYYSVDWHVKLAEGARIKKAIVSGYFSQDIKGLPAGVSVVNQCGFQEGGSRRKEGWFWANNWNMPQWREMVRRLNKMTGLFVASFQEKSEDDTFIVDGVRGRDHGQKGPIPDPREHKALTPQELLAASKDAELHVVGMYMPDIKEPGKPIEVEVQKTAKPVVLALSTGEAVWNVKLAQGARLKAVLVGGTHPQAVDGVPADVPIQRFCFDPSFFFGGAGRQQDKKSFFAYKWNTADSRRMVERLNDLTGLLVSTFQGEYEGTTSFVVDGKRGREYAQKERKPRPTLPKEPSHRELLALSAGAELHVVSMYMPGVESKKGDVIDVEVRPTDKVIVLVLASYMTVLWNVKMAPGARVKAVIIGGYCEQEFEGIPANIPIVYRSYFPSQKEGFFYSWKWNTSEHRRMVEQLNDLTGLLVSSYQGEYEGSSFVVDGKRGRDYAQKERKPRPKLPKEPTPQEFLAACAGAELHIVGMYMPDLNNKNGDAVDVEVRPTGKPIVLALASYAKPLWNVKIAPGAQVKAVIISGRKPDIEPEFEGIPANVPIICREIHANKWNTHDYREMVEKLNELTGLLVSTYQGEYNGSSFLVDGKRGRNFAQKERKPRPKFPKEPTPQQFLAASADSELHVASIYWSDLNSSNGDQVDVEVRATDKPIVLALVSYMTVLWNVKLAPGAQVKAVIVGGYNEQEFDGIPANIPIVCRTYYPSRKGGYFYGYEWKSKNCQQMVERLHDLTGLRVSTFQGEYTGTSFVVDGKQGRNFEQKKPKAADDPLADVADIPSPEHKAGGDADKRYFLIGPKKDSKPPAEGYGLLIVMPGGDGSVDFNPFVRRIYKNALSDRYLVAQPVAIKWTPDQKIVWPTKTNSVAKMKFSTEDFVDSVIEDVAKKHKIDRDKVFSLSWSSSGPAAYAVSLRNKSSVKGSFIAMSVFNPRYLPALKEAKGHVYYLYHSEGDRICPYRMAEQAKTSLTKNGAKVRLETYEGGHGWRGDLYNNIRQGIEWLEENVRRKPPG